MRQALAVVLLLSLMATPAWADSTERESLAGLPGVMVRAVVSSPGGRFGLTAAEVNAEVETALQRANIKVLNPGESFAHPAAPILIASVSISESNGRSMYSVEVRLHQTVKRWDGRELFAVPTWTAPREVGFGQLQERARMARANLAAQLSAFCIDFLVANSTPAEITRAAQEANGWAKLTDEDFAKAHAAAAAAEATQSPVPEEARETSAPKTR